MRPDLYEHLCAVIEKKFGVAPQFFRSENVLGRTAEDPPVMMVKTEDGYASAEVSDELTQREIDRLIGNLEATLVRQDEGHT